VTLLLHGRGGSTDDVLALADRMALPGMAYIAIPAASGTWYPKGFMAPFDENLPHLDWALDRIEGVVSDLEERGHSRNRVAILGFSQGACLGLEYVYRNPGRWGGVVAFTGGLLGPPEMVWATSASLRGTPVLFAASDIDAWVPLPRVQQSAQVFRALGAEVDERIYPGLEHLVNDEEIAAGRSLLADLLESRIQP
jgi:phospholipase/carboxylesterase